VDERFGSRLDEHADGDLCPLQVIVAVRENPDPHAVILPAFDIGWKRIPARDRVAAFTDRSSNAPSFQEKRIKPCSRDATRAGRGQ